MQNFYILIPYSHRFNTYIMISVAIPNLRHTKPVNLAFQI